LAWLPAEDQLALNVRRTGEPAKFDSQHGLGTVTGSAQAAYRKWHEMFGGNGVKLCDRPQPKLIDGLAHGASLQRDRPATTGPCRHGSSYH
jgi:hypothetical protein